MTKNTFSKNNNTKWFDENQNGARYGLKGSLIIEEESNYQKITIIETKKYGKALLLNNCWMTAEHQEKSYHECLVHPALTGAKEIRKVLIIGGGDGGSLRQCLLYKEVECIDLVEIDNRVIEICQEHLANIAEKSWEDPRVNIQIKDGIKWVSNSKDNSYDVIIIDGADPDGPAKNLFKKSFFKNCHRILRNGGVFASQTESPEAFLDVHIKTVKNLRKIFKYADPCYGSVPIYPSGWWSWTFAASDKARYLSPMKIRTSQIAQSCDVWSTRWQKGAFEAMPAFIERKLQNQKEINL